MGNYQDNARTRAMMLWAFASTYIGGVALATAMLLAIVRPHLHGWAAVAGTIGAYAASAFVANVVFGYLLRFTSNLPHGLGMILALVGIVVAGVLAATPVGPWWGMLLGPFVWPLLLLVLQQAK